MKDEKEEIKPHGFCVTPGSGCTMNYCDDNGCQNRERNLVKPESLEDFQKSADAERGYLRQIGPYKMKCKGSLGESELSDEKKMALLMNGGKFTELKPVGESSEEQKANKDCPKCEDCDCHKSKKFWQETARLMDHYRREGNEERVQGIVDCRIIYSRPSPTSEPPEERVQTSNPNKPDYFMCPNIVTDGFNKDWVELWDQVGLWYGDIRKEETGEQFLTRMKSIYNLTRKRD